MAPLLVEKLEVGEQSRKPVMFELSIGHPETPSLFEPYADLSWGCRNQASHLRTRRS